VDDSHTTALRGSEGNSRPRYEGQIPPRRLDLARSAFREAALENLSIKTLNLEAGGGGGGNPGAGGADLGVLLKSVQEDLARDVPEVIRVQGARGIGDGLGFIGQPPGKSDRVKATCHDSCPSELTIQRQTSFTVVCGRHKTLQCGCVEKMT